MLNSGHLISATASCLLAFPVLAAELTLEEAINQALANNRDLAQAALSIQSSAIDLRAAHFEFLPTIAPDGSLGYDEDGRAARAGLTASTKLKWGTQVEAGVSAGEQTSEFEEDQIDGALRVQVRQPLLRDRGRLVQEEPIRRAESGYLSVRRRYEQSRADLVVQVARTHQDLARLQQQVIYDEQSLERYLQLEKLTRVRSAQGRATRIDTLRVEFQRGSAEFDLSSTREQLRSVQQDLAELLGIAASADIVAVASPALDLVLPAPDEAEVIAFSNRLDFADGLQRMKDSERGVLVARNGVLPTLDLVTRYERTGEGEDLGEAFSFDEEMWFLGLSGDSDVFRRNEKASLGRARIDVLSTEQQLEALKANIRRQVQQALLQYQRSREQAVFAERNVTLANDRARLARRLFQLGRGDNFTVTDAEAELLQAQSRLLQSQTESTIAAYSVLRSLGTLVESPQELKPESI